MENKKLERIGEWVGFGIVIIIMVVLIVLSVKFLIWVWSL